jgi:hypothetical protein
MVDALSKENEDSQIYFVQLADLPGTQSRIDSLSAL